MHFQINRTALKFLLNVLLSCRCPVSQKTEAELINYYKDTADKSVVDYESVIAIVNNEGEETAFHRLREFCTYSIDDFSNSYVISINDVLRHFCTAYHWHVVEESLPNSYRNLTDIPSWFVSHMLLPVDLTTNAGEIKGSFIHPEGRIVLRNLFLPSDLQIRAGAFYCAHFATVIGEISLQQANLVRGHLEEISGFRNLSKQVSEIDFHKFQRFGDYASFSRERFEQYF